MKQIPILFNTEMVQAIDEGRKTQTRRTKGFEWINKNIEGVLNPVLTAGDNNSVLANFKSDKNPLTFFSGVKCPYGNVGDILWVRETYGMQAIGEFPYEFYPVYKAQEDSCGQFPGRDENGSFLHINFKENWRPSIHMPKDIARTWLKITDIRVERIQDVSAADAIAEGIQVLDSWPEAPDKKIYRLYNWETFMGEPACFDPIQSFFTLWCQTYGPSAVKDNPFVWVIEFEKTENPNNEAKPDKYIDGKVQVDFGPFGMP